MQARTAARPHAMRLPHAKPRRPRKERRGAGLLRPRRRARQDHAPTNAPTEGATRSRPYSFLGVLLQNRKSNGICLARRRDKDVGAQACCARDGGRDKIAPLQWQWDLPYAKAAQQRKGKKNPFVRPWRPLRPWREAKDMRRAPPLPRQPPAKQDHQKQCA